MDQARAYAEALWEENQRSYRRLMALRDQTRVFYEAMQQVRGDRTRFVAMEAELRQMRIEWDMAFAAFMRANREVHEAISELTAEYLTTVPPAGTRRSA